MIESEAGAYLRRQADLYQTEDGEPGLLATTWGWRDIAKVFRDAARAVESRYSTGWTLITPDTLPGKDVDVVLAIGEEVGIRSVRIRPRARLKGAETRHRWSHLLASPNDYSAWRPVPDGWLPMPTKEPS